MFFIFYLSKAINNESNIAAVIASEYTTTLKIKHPYAYKMEEI
jgi:hypothetical protein